MRNSQEGTSRGLFRERPNHSEHPDLQVQEIGAPTNWRPIAFPPHRQPCRRCVTMLRMSPLSRRDLCQSLPLLALLPSLAAHAQTPTQTPAPAAAPPASDCTQLALCQAIPAGPDRTPKNGVTGHQILVGHIPGITNIEVHETKLDPGKAPHPPHRHPNAEFLCVRQGSLEFTSDAAPVTVAAGGTIYCAPNQLHGVHNNGDTQAIYFVLEIGREPACPN